jgi:hypothetical protein
MPDGELEAHRRRQHGEASRIYREWIASMEEWAARGDKGAIADLEFLKANSGKSRETILTAPLPFEPSRAKRQSSDAQDEDETNPADDVVDANTAIDELEPLDVHESDLAKIGDHFTAALIWASQAKTLVEMGWRIHAMLRVFRPALLEGMELEARMEQECELRKALGVGRRAIAKISDYYRGVFYWLFRCNSLSQLGQRGFAMIYCMRRDLIGKLNTNAALGGLSNKTRQAFNKTVQDFRDSNHGFRNGVMRDESTRIKCQIAQTSEN